VRSRDSAIGIATGYRLDGRGFGFRIPVGASRPDQFWWPTKPPIQREKEDIFLRVKRKEREADTDLQLVLRSGIRGLIQSLPDTSSGPSTCLVNHRINFLFTKEK
jgi:hypothetical protein